MDLRAVGSVLLIIGTSIGAGLLALPLVTAQAGFFNTFLLLILCWFLMTAGALYLLELNLQMPLNSNLITMSKNTLGKKGQTFTWVIYLLLLYALLSAYLAGGGDLIKDLTHLVNIHGPSWFDTITFLLILGFVVYKGIRSVDWVNRGLMLAKLITFALLTAFTLPFVNPQNIERFAPQHFFSAVMIVITSFGFAIVIPSLRIYLRSDAKQLKRAIIIGSLIPLTCYLLWIFAIQGVINLDGKNGLLSIATSMHPITHLTVTLSETLNTDFMRTLTHIFASICIVTSFLGVSLCLSDFLSDGLQLAKKGKDGLIVHSATFLPPLLVVLFFPGIFIQALSYAGILCVVLLILLPALMTWQQRKKQTNKPEFQAPGGKQLLILMFAASAFLLFIGIYQIF